MCNKRIPARYAFKVLYETCCAISTLKYCKVRKDADEGCMLNLTQNAINALCETACRAASVRNCVS